MPCEQLMNKGHSEPVRAAMKIRGILICSQERAGIRISWIPDKNASLRVYSSDYWEVRMPDVCSPSPHKAHQGLKISTNKLSFVVIWKNYSVKMSYWQPVAAELLRLGVWLWMAVLRGVTNSSFLKDVKLAAGRHEENWRSWREEMVGGYDQCSLYKCLKKLSKIKELLLTQGKFQKRGQKECMSQRVRTLNYVVA